jgi:SIR2-like domain
MEQGKDVSDDLLQKAIELLGQQYGANQNFNDYFDADEPVEIGTLLYPRSKVLFWVDRSAYVAEKAAWENEENENKHERAKALLKANGYEHRFVDLLQAITRDRLVPFVGAGLSKAAGMPLWGEALTQLLARLPDANTAAISADIMAGRFLEAAQALAEHDRVQTAHFIRTTYRVQQLRLAGPVKHLPRFARGCVITTNFDDALEKTFESSGVKFEHYMHGTQEHNFFTRMVRGDRCILKLHGDAENDATHILTKAQYEAAYGDPFDFRKPLPKALRQIFVTQSLLFLGCSLDQDWTMELFRRAKEDDGYQIPNHYAILPEPADQGVKRTKETSLLALNIQPLWYPDGEHAVVEQVLALIVDVSEKRFAFNV